VDARHEAGHDEMKAAAPFTRSLPACGMLAPSLADGLTLTERACTFRRTIETEAASNAQVS